jgi:hypothetical protein
MGLFSGIQDAQATGQSGNYIKAGVHQLELKRCIQGQTRKKIGFMVAEFKVIKSDVHKPGEIVSYMATDDKDAFLGNCKSLFVAIVAAYGGLSMDQVDHSSIDEELSDGITAEPGNAYAGVVLHCTAINVPTKAKTLYTKCLWEV